MGDKILGQHGIFSGSVIDHDRPSHTWGWSSPLVIRAQSGASGVVIWVCGGPTQTPGRSPSNSLFLFSWRTLLWLQNSECSIFAFDFHFFQGASPTPTWIMDPAGQWHAIPPLPRHQVAFSSTLDEFYWFNSVPLLGASWWKAAEGACLASSGICRIRSSLPSLLVFRASHLWS